MDDLTPTPLPARKANAASTTPEPGPRPAVEELDFVDAGSVSLALQRPFNWDGKLIDSITIREPITQEMLDIYTRARSEDIDRFDIYAVMTGLPAAVLRGLKSVDGEALVTAASPFLPRAARAG
jgi:hypothetical protein